MPNPGYRVLITTSGFGQRLGDLTKYTNKSLVRVGNKPALAYIIESYPEDVELVITIRYFGDLVKEFVELAYPNRKIIFSEEPQEAPEGKAFSLGYSMLQAKQHLQCPFIFHAGDTIVTEPIPTPLLENWNGGFKGESSTNFRSFTTLGDKIQLMNDKGATDFDFIHIGLVGIKDYRQFWKHLEELHENNPADTTLGDVPVLEQMLKDGTHIRAKEFGTWLDIGNTESLAFARKHIGENISVLEKVDESIYIFEKYVIKFFSNPKLVENRVRRAQILDGLVPNIESSRRNFYRYKYVEGDLYSRVVNPADFSRFLEWAQIHLWKPVQEVSEKEFREVCYDFYYTKTKKRLLQFMDANGIVDGETVVNGQCIPPIFKLLERVDFDWLCNTTQTLFHGDFILDNIIKTDTGYQFLDWRQDFGGLLKAGDIYYDFAKLNHNLTVNHDLVHRDLFTVEARDEQITCDILRSENLVTCKEVLFKFLERNGYDLKKVRILTAIIWLNMSPLHHHPFNLFLFYFGKLNLWRSLNL